MLDTDALSFDGRGLIPAIITDARSSKVLSLCYMNRESLKISLEKKLCCFYSRSRQKLWLKGETSGNFQHIVSICADCDRDALLIRVEKDGPACHTGSDSCFKYTLFEKDAEEALQSIGPSVPAKAEKVQGDKEDLKTGGEADDTADDAANKETGGEASSDDEDFSEEKLYALLRERKATLPEASYTSYLFKKGLDKILKKVGEEATEVIIAAKARDRKETIYELADLAYHLNVLMAELEISPAELKAELASRRIIDSKVKQEKMTSDD